MEKEKTGMLWHLDWILPGAISVALLAEGYFRFADGGINVLLWTVALASLGWCIFLGIFPANVLRLFAGLTTFGLVLLVGSGSIYPHGCFGNESGIACAERQRLESLDAQARESGSLFLDHRSTDVVVKPKTGAVYSEGIWLATGTTAEEHPRVLTYLIPSRCTGGEIAAPTVTVRVKQLAGSSGTFNVLACRLE